MLGNLIKILFVGIALLSNSSLVIAQSVGFSKTFLEVTEGEVLKATVKLDERSSEDITISYSFEGIEAKLERDFLDQHKGSVTIASGELENTIVVNILDDTKIEEEESFRIFLGNPLSNGSPKEGLELNHRKVVSVWILDNESTSDAVLQDFETEAVIENTNFVLTDVSTSSPLVLPEQTDFETVLTMLPNKNPQNFQDDFLVRQNWLETEALSFWYYGDHPQDIIVNISATDPEKTTSLEIGELIWQDEFNDKKGTPPNSDYWTIELGDGAGWGNSEHQLYTNDAENLFQDGQGNLVIRAKKLSETSTLDCYYGPCKYTSARIKTEDKFDVQYGRIEGRMKIPGGQGFWPAFWMLGNNFKTVNWPYSGEIDIMENIGREPLKIHGTVHGPGYSGGNGPSSTAFLPKREAFANEFHTYAIEWEQDEIRWYLNGSNYHTLRPEDLPADKVWVFDHPFFILLNLAVGGSWPGYPDDSSIFPQDFIIDYLRVYELPQVRSSFSLMPTASQASDSNWHKITIPLQHLSEESLKEVWNYSITLAPSTTEQHIDRLEIINLP